MQGMRKKCVAMLLAGGQGSRLGVLTKHTAKPAVPFGGKYRIIDFPLSNCVNSGLDTVGIMTQYQPLELNDYIGNGRPWGLNRSFGGVHVLPPYAKSKKSEWYKGTANAIYQNIHFVDRYDPDYVIVLSGDHIYKMDYSKMLDYHKETGSECTIAVFDVPLSEASRFGIMNLNEDGSIYEFEEKPKNPKSTKASMGIYIFNWQLLKEYLIADEKNPESSNDFGKDIIPKLLGDGKKLYAYLFEGYWKDVGTIESLWEANMDLLDPEIPIQLKDPDFKIFARNYAKPSSFIASSAVIDNSFVSEGCVIKGRASNSVVSVGCEIEDGAIVENSVIMPNTIIKKGASVKYSIIGESCIIGENAVVGTNDKKISVIGHNKVVPDGAAVSGQEVKL